MFIHIKLADGTYCAHREVFEGKAEDIISNTVARAGDLLCKMLDKA